jgi:hypothetical protein
MVPSGLSEVSPYTLLALIRVRAHLSRRAGTGATTLALVRLKPHGARVVSEHTE